MSRSSGLFYHCALVLLFRPVPAWCMYCPPVIMSAAAGGVGVGLAGRALAVSAGGLQQGLHAGVGVVTLHLVTCHVSRVTIEVLV